MIDSKLEKRWASVHQLIDDSDRIVFSTHISPDGDGLGSQLAMARFLEKRGKECRIFNPTPLPGDMHFLTEFGTFEEYDRQMHFDWVKSADLAIAFDIGDYKRLGRLGHDFQKACLPALSIDHHPHPSPNGFTYSVHDISACATGFLVYEYIKYANGKNGSRPALEPEIAKSLYVAILTDTGSFRFNNTSAEAHEMASELIRSGVRPYDVYEQVYESTPVERIRLMALALDTVEVEGDGTLAWFTVTKEMMEEAGAKDEHVGGFTDLVRSIKGVEVAAMVHEKPGGQSRVNFRSKGRVRIDELARCLGGGGHAFAAGVLLEQPIEEATSLVVSKILTEIKIQLNLEE
ncbi:MAG: bifunctional oligoribonuclease/PAP phosphatase NrnA [Candidatus Marinimicrobia bacterium]|jgi:phosphoesterase RecJ-like protein|nr:bifunctional oligoribonuclease/PAP phosphatase NrnA [Candidatus Neomarinimicrobiota bacterium]MDP6594146.1 bifunctional oligoribonuclease/PAP phosphatase NrnA [Candidatus Neomarinimicrobiota bacterium]MDP6835624.1 bifunctional oligoribonuclease/PAP phosphatase NrnA [Candidatus Neomarinimicrobiota bacterium]|tara:strand:- start:136 stop:1176 length:1041 start_codon:yes stop_codon:yes gene_type:complete